MGCYAVWLLLGFSPGMPHSSSLPRDALMGHQHYGGRSQALSSRFSAMVVRLRTHVRSCEICGQQHQGRVSLANSPTNNSSTFINHPIIWCHMVSVQTAPLHNQLKNTAHTNWAIFVALQTSRLVGRYKYIQRSPAKFRNVRDILGHEVRYQLRSELKSSCLFQAVTA
jgi:hypothetical protein